MARDMINENEIEQVVGGSIVFNGDHTTCGRNCNNQYKVLNYSAMLEYIAANCQHMSERQMLNNMLAKGWITNL